jgi:hypothetical protein
VDGHERGEAAFLHQRHADGGGDPDVLERRGLLRRELAEVVVDDERQAGAEVRHRELAKVSEAVVPDDARQARCRPVATDGEAVLVLIHVGVGADR